MVSTPKRVCRHVPFGSAEYKAILQLRYISLRMPLGMQFTESELAIEEESYQLGVWRAVNAGRKVRR